MENSLMTPIVLFVCLQASIIPTPHWNISENPGGHVGNGTDPLDQKLENAALQAMSMIAAIDLRKLDLLKISDEAKNILRLRQAELHNLLKPSQTRIVAVDHLEPLSIEHPDGSKSFRNVHALAYRGSSRIEYDKAKCETEPLIKISYVLIQEAVHLLPPNKEYPEGINDDRDGLVFEIASAVILLASPNHEIRKALVNVLIDSEEWDADFAMNAVQYEMRIRLTERLFDLMTGQNVLGVPTETWRELLNALNQRDRRILLGVQDKDLDARDDAIISKLTQQTDGKRHLRYLSPEQMNELLSKLSLEECQKLTNAPREDFYLALETMAVEKGILPLKNTLP